MRLSRLLVGVVAVTVIAQPARGQDDKIVKQFSAAQTEALLGALKIDFKKTNAKTEGIVYYDFQRGGHTVRLYWYGGKDLMLDVVFPKLALERINLWNVRAKFSRACLHKDDKGEFTALEANLDIVGGVTDGAVRQFLLVFDDEVKAFAKFAGGGASIDEPIYTKVTSDKLEAILKGLNFEFKKTEVKGGAVAYDFTVSNHQLRLVNFAGEDLMIDAHFKKLLLKDVNQYNIKRKFIRCVAYKIDAKEYTSLEANLDCAGGVSDSIVRHFLRAFDEEVKEFSKYVQEK